MSSPESLKKQIEFQEPCQLEGRFFRLVHQRYRDGLLSTQGSLKYGGRYNPPGAFGALYLADSEALAQTEVLRAVGDPSALAAVFVCGEIRVRLQRVLDLTDPQVLKALGIERTMLLADTDDRQRDHAFTRQLGQLARAAGFEALKVPSVTSQGANLVVFPENLSAPDQLDLRQIRDIEWKIKG